MMTLSMCTCIKVKGYKGIKSCGELYIRDEVEFLHCLGLGCIQRKKKPLQNESCAHRIQPIQAKIWRRL